MFDDNFDTVQAPDPNVKIADTMDRLFKTNKYKYDDPFGNPEDLSPNIKTCQDSITMTSTYDEKNSETLDNSSYEKTNNNNSIRIVQDLLIIPANNIFAQNSKDYFKAYKHLHGIDMQIRSIRKPP
jgi:hypothetical protein